MGLCPSRNTNLKNQKVAKAQTFTPLEPAPAPRSALRADADAFVPTPKAAAVAASEKKEKEAWEAFLDQKQQEQQQVSKTKVFARKTDGTYTADYRRLLDQKEKEPKKPKYVPPQQRSEQPDWIQEWKQAKKPPPRAPPGLTKKPVAPAAPLDADAKLKQALQRVKQQVLPKDAALAQLEQVAQAQAKDDLAVPSEIVPFGLTDSHYLSDKDDDAQSHRHPSGIKTKGRSYAKPASEALETAMTACLHKMRQLRQAEQQAGIEKEGRRYCVGIREVARLLKDKQNCSLKAVLVAPDVEADGKTVRGSLDDRLSDLIKQAEGMQIPVVYGLSRTRLGQAVKKSVSISVLGILSVRGMQEPFELMLKEA